MSNSEFELTKDAYIEKHNASLVAGLTHDDFRQQKIGWVSELVLKQNKPLRVIDFGFGPGELLEDLHRLGPALSLGGVEPSEVLRQELLRRHSGQTFAPIVPALDELPDCSIDVMTCFNVLHHIPPADRAKLASVMSAKLAHGGRLLIWEHNPYNPATQFIVGRCEYDDDAVLLKKSEVHRLFNKLQIETSHYVNVTPPSLQSLPFFRWFDRALSWFPVGAQYRVAFRKVA